MKDYEDHGAASDFCAISLKKKKTEKGEERGRKMKKKSRIRFLRLFLKLSNRWGIRV